MTALLRRVAQQQQVVSAYRLRVPAWAAIRRSMAYFPHGAGGVSAGAPRRTCDSVTSSVPPSMRRIATRWIRNARLPTIPPVLGIRVSPRAPRHLTNRAMGRPHPVSQMCCLAAG
jgi:hypothetical protein